jgi:hypothetical protein
MNEREQFSYNVVVMGMMKTHTTPKKYRPTSISGLRQMLGRAGFGNRVSIFSAGRGSFLLNLRTEVKDSNVSVSWHEEAIRWQTEVPWMYDVYPASETDRLDNCDDWTADGTDGPVTLDEPTRERIRQAEAAVRIQHANGMRELIELLREKGYVFKHKDGRIVVRGRRS